MNFNGSIGSVHTSLADLSNPWVGMHGGQGPICKIPFRPAVGMPIFSALKKQRLMPSRFSPQLSRPNLRCKANQPTRYVTPYRQMIQSKLGGWLRQWILACRLGIHHFLHALADQERQPQVLSHGLGWLESCWQRYCCYELIGAVACRHTYHPLAGAQVQLVLHVADQHLGQERRVVLARARTLANGSFQRLYVDKHWLDAYSLAIEIEAKAYYKRVYMLRKEGVNDRQMMLFALLEEAWL